MKDATIEKRRDHMQQIKNRYGEDKAATKIKEAREKREEKGSSCFSLSQDSIIGRDRKKLGQLSELVRVGCFLLTLDQL